MSTIYNIKTLVHGEHSLAKEVIKIIPLIEKHFKPFDGQRASIQSGRSAKFNKVVKAFYAECETITNARISIESNQYNIKINIDINEPDPDSRGGGCNYFKTWLYIGEFESLGAPTYGRSMDMSYTFDPDQARASYQRILITTVPVLEKTKKTIQELKDKIDKLESSVPYTFKDAISR